MSTVTLVAEETYDCEYPDCEETRTPSSSVGGSYCSQECRDRATGEQFLCSIRQDHRFCWSCLRQRKEIERPTAETRRGLGPITDAALVGYEYHTRHADMGEHGLECTCGAVDHDIPDWLRRETGPYHWYLTRLVEVTRAEGQHDYAFDLATFADRYWETDDLDLAVGAALS